MSVAFLVIGADNIINSVYILEKTVAGDNEGASEDLWLLEDSMFIRDWLGVNKTQV